MRSLVRPVALCSLLLAAACESAPPTAEEPTSDLSSMASTRDDGPIVFGVNSSPYGRTLTQWNKAWWRWELSVPTDRNPSLDPTGEHCAEHQEGRVWKLGALFGSGAVTRSCRIPAGKAILINLSSALNDFPCPDPTFRPAPGQSLYDFLAPGARAVEDGVNSLTLTVDAASVGRLFDRRYPTRLFAFKGDTSLRTSIDGCITGTRQVGVSDGFFVMLKPLSHGKHRVVLTAGSVNGLMTSVTYDLTVERSRDGH